MQRRKLCHRSWIKVSAFFIQKASSTIQLWTHRRYHGSWGRNEERKLPQSTRIVRRLAQERQKQSSLPAGEGWLFCSRRTFDGFVAHLQRGFQKRKSSAQSSASVRRRFDTYHKKQTGQIWGKRRLWHDFAMHDLYGYFVRSCYSSLWRFVL